MPLQWKIDHQTQRVEAVAVGTVSAADVRDYLARIAEAGAMPYAKLFDASEARASLSVDELRDIGTSIRRFAMNGFGPIGPLAIVVHSGNHLEAGQFADAAGSNRPLQIFRNKADAVAWLAKIAPLQTQRS